ncbi:hypothetical protein, partial [Asaia prunellae]|uniref:hypothetical protein n=1 Tax=Asaia prunellae TaxID=610245 RepID=UPI001A7F03CD
SIRLAPSKSARMQETFESSFTTVRYCNDIAMKKCVILAGNRIFSGYTEIADLHEAIGITLHDAAFP